MRPEVDRPGCNIVAVSSIAGVDAMGSMLAYRASKAALNHFVKNLAKEVGHAGIRINAIAPGNILFPGGSGAYSNGHVAALAFCGACLGSTFLFP